MTANDSGDQGSGSGSGTGVLGRLRTPSADLLPRAARRGRRSMHTRVDRLRQRAFLIGQVSLAAAAAWWVAHVVLGHSQPFFAPVAAIVGLGTSYAQRPRRVAEVTAGVAVGVVVGDVFVSVAGTGVWQIILVVGVAMSVAVLLDAGTLIVTQAGVQSVIVTTLLPSADAGLSRWVDAVIGGLVALAVATVAPVTPLRRPWVQAARVQGELAVLLREAAASLRDNDAERAVRTLRKARDTDSSLRDLGAAAREGLAVTRTPLRRRHQESVAEVAALAEPLDRAVRNVRVLVRRVSVAVSRAEPVPVSYAALAERLADVVEDMAAGMHERRVPPSARARLQALGAESAEVEAGRALSAIVVLAQLRSTIVDLLQLTGMDSEHALSQVPPRPPAPDRPDGPEPANTG